jgi:hypothetical protein
MSANNWSRGDTMVAWDAGVAVGRVEAGEKDVALSSLPAGSRKAALEGVAGCGACRGDEPLCWAAGPPA